MRDLFFAIVFLEPLVKALRNDDTPLLLFHGRPHATVFEQ
jgi:hypothetical protein